MSPLLPDADRLTLLERPLALAAGLADLCGTLADGPVRPWLFERPAGRSVLVTRTALSIRARGSEVRVTAGTPLGRVLLDALGWRFRERQVEREEGLLVLSFPRAAAFDMDARLKEPSAMDVLRSVSFDLSCEADGSRAPVLLLGVLAFDHVDLFEDVGAAASDPTGFPDFDFRLAEEALLRTSDGMTHGLVLTADRREGLAALNRLASRAEGAVPLCQPPAASAATADADLDDNAFKALVETCKAHIAAGDVFQIVPSRAFAAPCEDAFSAFRRLRALSPSPAMFHLEGEGWTLFGASPETAVKVTSAKDGGWKVEVSPIAGTRPRASSALDDEALGEELLADPKERAEHMMLVDLARNDVARVSAPATRKVEALCELHRFAQVMHLVSKVTGRLRDDLDALHALAACMNCGTLSGAPKIEATRLIRRYEGARRGPYGGAVCLVGGDGSLDSAIVIRSAFVKDGVARVRAGAGVVADSVPQAEADETRAKAQGVLRALGVAG